MKLPDFKLERFFAKHEFSAKHLLCSSDCEAMKISELLHFEKGATEGLMKCWLGYTESPGDPKLRQAIAQIYEKVSADDVLVFTGAEEAIYLYMQGMLTSSDHAIVHSPCYQSLFEVANATAGQVDRWNGHPEKNWKLDLNELESLIKPNTKLIVINTPHNPTGYLMDHEDWKSLHSMAAERGIKVFCDEVYRESEYDPEDRLTAGCDMGEHAISLGVMSKTYGLAGLRIGWIATQNKAVYEKMQSMKDYTTICNSRPSEYLAELALRHRDRLVKRNLSIISKNLDLLDDFFANHPETFEWNRPRAGAIAFPRLREGDVSEFCENVLSETGVLLAPAEMFNVDGGHFRLGFGRADMKVGLEALANYLVKV